MTVTTFNINAFISCQYVDRFTNIVDVNIIIYNQSQPIYVYQTQSMYSKWGKFYSTCFKYSNDVRQGGMLSTKLFAIYIDKLNLYMCVYIYKYMYIHTSISLCITAQFLIVQLLIYKPRLTSAEQLHNNSYIFLTLRN